MSLINQSAVEPFPVQPFSSFEEDVVPLLEKNQIVAEHVDREGTIYKTIDPRTAVKDLDVVGKLLEAAYAASKGTRCNPAVMSLLIEYQAICKQALLACSEFVDTTMEGLQYHAMAMSMIEKQDVDKAKEFIDETGQLAAEMVEVTRTLEQQFSIMHDKSSEACCEASKAVSARKQEVDEMEKKFKEDKIEKTAMENQADLLLKQVTDALESEHLAAEAVAAEETLRRRVLSTVTAPWRLVGSVWYRDISILKSQADVAKEELKAIQQTRKEIENRKLEQAIKLASSVAKLENAFDSGNPARAAQWALDVTSTVLGRIVNVFVNSRVFWQCVQKHCKKLAAHRAINKLDGTCIDELRDSVSKNGYSWMALGRMNYLAFCDMKKASDGVDHVMCNLPMFEDARKRVRELCLELGIAIHAEIEDMRSHQAAYPALLE